MPRKKKAAPVETLTLSKLCKIAEEIGLPEGVFDGDLEDACDDEAELMKENIKSDTLYEQLEFLYLHGFQLNRLEQMIHGLAKEDRTDA